MKISYVTILSVMLLVGILIGLLIPYPYITSSKTVSAFSEPNSSWPAPFDIIADYQIMARNNDAMAMCIDAKKIVEKYHSARDPDCENQWRSIEKRDCEIANNGNY